MRTRLLICEVKTCEDCYVAAGTESSWKGKDGHTYHSKYCRMAKRTMTKRFSKRINWDPPRWCPIFEKADRVMLKEMIKEKM